MPVCLRTCVQSTGLCGAPMGQSKSYKVLSLFNPCPSLRLGLPGHTCASVSIHVSVSCARIQCLHVPSLCHTTHVHVCTHRPRAPGLPGPPAVEVTMSCTFRKMTAFLAGHGCGAWGQRSRYCMWWLCRNCNFLTKDCSELSRSWMMALAGRQPCRGDPGVSCSTGASSRMHCADRFQDGPRPDNGGGAPPHPPGSPTIKKLASQSSLHRDPPSHLSEGPLTSCRLVLVL